MSRSTQTIINCDFCQTRITDKIASVMEKDVCVECLKKLHDEVDLEFNRVVNGLVPDRRGGMRQLGMYEG